MKLVNFDEWTSNNLHKTSLMLSRTPLTNQSPFLMLTRTRVEMSDQWIATKIIESQTNNIDRNLN